MRKYTFNYNHIHNLVGSVNQIEVDTLEKFKEEEYSPSGTLSVMKITKVIRDQIKSLDETIASLEDLRNEKELI